MRRIWLIAILLCALLGGLAGLRALRGKNA